jgi:hypothetical protein
MNQNEIDLLTKIVCDAFDAGAITDSEHDVALDCLNGN